MLSKAAKQLGIRFSAVGIPEAWSLIKDVDPTQVIITFEQEHIDENLLAAIEARGIPSFPSWKSFLRMKSKRTQKELIAHCGIASAPHVNASPWTAATDAFIREHQGAVLKSGKGGYDGKGVWLVEANGQTKDGPAAEVAAKLVDPYIEKRVNFSAEIAAVVCRSATGEIESYPTVRSIQQNGICFQVEYTKEFAQTAVAQKAKEIAKQIAEGLQYVGVLAVECFVQGEEVLVNEIAPRVHNSGHFTIDVCAGSQFENHLRAGLGMPLARTEPTHPAALMVNLLWPPSEKDFAPLFTRLTCGAPWPENVKLHWYGKSEARPWRKMGHFTVYGETLAECHKVADQILDSRWASR